MIDTHAHLYLEDFDEDRDAIMQRAAAKGVKKIYLPNIDSGTIDALLRMEKNFSGRALPMMGLHPGSVKDNWEEELGVIKKWLAQHSFAAVGEIGLDFYWDVTYKEQQIAAFKQQIDWALAHQLPIVIHARNALDDCIDIVRSKQNGALTGIFHCFSGTVKQAKEIIGLGFFMGVGGIVTFKKATLPEVIKEIPLQHLVLETDAPYLTPAPHRGKRNESSYIPHIAEKLAAIKDVPLAEVAAVTTANAGQIYQL